MATIDRRDYPTFDAYEKAKEQERDSMRALQDQIVELSESKGYKEDMRVSRHMPADITLNHLRYYLYPDYKNELETVLSVLLSPALRREY